MCNSCIHKEVCKYIGEYKAFVDECLELNGKMKSYMFKVEVPKCKYFKDEKTYLVM